MNPTTHQRHAPQKPFFLLRAPALLCAGALCATLAGCGVAPGAVSASETPPAATAATQPASRPAAQNPYEGWATRLQKDIPAEDIIGQVGASAIAATMQMEGVEGEDNTVTLTLTALDAATFEEKATVTFDDMPPATWEDNFVRLRGEQLVVLCETRVLTLNENLETMQETPLPQAVIDAMQPEENASGGENAVGFTGYDVSNDRTRYVYGDSAGLFLCDAATGATRRLFENIYTTWPEDGMPNITALCAPRFTADDQQVAAHRIVFYAEYGSMYLFDLAAGTSETFTIYPQDSMEGTNSLINPTYAAFGSYFGGVLGTGGCLYHGENHYAVLYADPAGNESTWEIYCGRLDDPDLAHAKKTPVNPFSQDGSWTFSMLADGRILFRGEDGNLYCSLPYEQMPLLIE